MAISQENLIRCIEQSCEDANSLHELWCSQGVNHFTRVHVVDAIRLSHRIAGGCATFGIETIASMAKLCEHVCNQVKSQYLDELTYISPQHRQKIADVVHNLYDASLKAKSEYYEKHSAPLAATNNKGSAVGHSSNGLKILVADDDPAMRIFIQRKLESRGFDVVIAEDGQQAVDKALQYKPDLILMDGLMPKLTGFEALSVLKNDVITSQTPVFMLTALSEQENVVDGMINGADDYIIKPFNVDDVVEKIMQRCSLRA